MNILIIEDEKIAAERLMKLLKKYDEKIIVLDIIDSIKNSVNWLTHNALPDLIFLDIQLADGISFDIFNQVDITCPIIFVTAYDTYAIRAFKVNSIDYLLKPLDFEEFKKAIDKFKNIRQPQITSDFINVFKNMIKNNYKNRFIVKIGEHIKTVDIDYIYYFYSYKKTTYINTVENKNYIIDFSLEYLESIINPDAFFRINRKYIINISSIKDIITYSSSRLKIILANSSENDIIVSRERIYDFKRWLDK